jgi:hypothetical protein
MIIIGLTGSAYSGKDTAASAKCFDNYVKLAFATPIKDAVGILYLMTYNQLHTDTEKEIVDPRYNKSPRQVMQELGSYLRSQDPNFFCNLMTYKIKDLQKLGHKLFIVTDVRYDNEARVIRELGGHVIKIERKSKTVVMPGTLQKHASEQGISPELLDHVVNNDSTIDVLHNKMEEMVKKWH